VCCPAAGFTEEGWYCVNTEGGTGTVSSDCEPIYLTAEDACGVVICSGPYESAEAAAGGCGDFGSAPLCNHSVGQGPPFENDLETSGIPNPLSTLFDHVGTNSWEFGLYDPDEAHPGNEANWTLTCTNPLSDDWTITSSNVFGSGGPPGNTIVAIGGSTTPFSLIFLVPTTWAHAGPWDGNYYVLVLTEA
jgi:hypothetical protein